MLGLGLGYQGSIGRGTDLSAITVNTYLDSVLIDSQVSNNINIEIINIVWL